MTGPAVWRERAIEGWRALDGAGLATTRAGLVVREPGRRRREPLWPFSQVLHAAVAVEALDATVSGRLTSLWSALEAYRRGEAYGERPGGRRRYYDDNAWIALAALEDDRAEPLALVARVVGWLRTGAGEDGGVLWVEGGATRNACSTGGTGLVAARLASRIPPGPDRASLEALADRCTAFLLRLRDDDGMVADHVRADGSVDPRVFAYNQGLLLGLLAERGRADEAVAHARRTTEVLDPERLWRQPAVFAAILVREIARLVRARPDPAVSSYAEAWAERVWADARDPRTGLLVLGGIGRYDGGVLLDHAAVVTALAALAGERAAPSLRGR